jgi:murein DD-endopeptidase MepM/ murein hydrolase activator NlpD
MFPRPCRTTLASLALALAACEPIEQVQDRFRDLTPHEAYAEALAAAGLAESALARDWTEAGQLSLRRPIPVSAPFEEEGFITPEDPTAVAYRISVPRGRRLHAAVSLTSDEGTRVFVDLFRIPDDEGDALRPVISTDSVPGTFEHEPWRGGDFILRIQPELLRGGRYRVTLHLEAQLAFPVEGHGMRSIQSVFGVDRDAGRRTHDGVDIFARRGTPVLAATAGQVYRVGITGLGGKVVWVRDPLRNIRVYYAHLDSQHVRNGDRIAVGDTLGFVGNTGNARTTPPHLHFGLYRGGEGAVDPMPFLAPSTGTLAKMSADLEQLGDWARLREDGPGLRAAPGARAPVMRDLARHTAFRVLAGSGEYFRVALPDGATGYVAARATEPVDLPLGEQVAARGDALRSRPDRGEPAVATLESEARLPVLGRFEDFLYVRGPRGYVGWLDATASALE